MEKVISAVFSGLYILVLCAFMALAVFSAGEELPPYARDPPYRRPFRRMALWVIKKVELFRQKRRQQGRELLLPGEEGVRSDLRILYPSLKAAREEILYRMEKYERLLLFLFAVILAAGALHVQSFYAGILREDGSVLRQETGGGDRQLTVRAFPQTQEEENEDYGTYTVTVHERQLTRKEAAAGARKILDQFPETLLGENESAEQIRSPLVMPAAAQILPYTLSWESGRYAVLDTDGSVFNTDYGEDQAEEVELTAVLTCGEYRFQKKMVFIVRAPLRDEKEKLQDTVNTALVSAEKESADKESFRLPSKAGDLAVTWQEKVQDVSAGILVLGVVICVLIWYAADCRLHEKTRERNRQLAIDYPQLTSKMVLYLGAGMSVRNVFYKCAAEYRQKCAASQKRQKKKNHSSSGRQTGRRWLYEEVLLVCNELDSGVPEEEAYMHFGRRCHLRQYTKLCTLLVQNLRRGNDTLLQVLREEAENSFEERKNLARELGEEAGTRLLLPMMIMLGITMLIIIVPAYFSFSM